MGKLSNNRAQIVAGGLISASFVSDLYDIFTGAVTESVQLTGSMKITGSMIVTQGVTASLQGTSSWSNNAITASYVSLVAGPNIIINTNGTNYEITGSPFTYYIDSASFDSRIIANSSSIALLSSSFLTDSASFDSRIIANSSSIAILSGSYLLDSASFSSSIITNQNNYLIDSASFDSSVAILSSSYVTTSASFSSGIVNLVFSSASFASNILINSSSITILSGSFLTNSSSDATRLSALELFSSSLDTSYASETQFTSFTASYQNDSASFASRSTALEIFSGSVATTGSNTFGGVNVFNNLEANDIISPIIYTGYIEEDPIQQQGITYVANSNLPHKFLGNVDITGSVNVSGSQTINGNLTVTSSLFAPSTTQQNLTNVVVIDTATGRLHYTASSALYGNVSGSGVYSGSSFTTFAVTGQSSIVAANATDTMTITAGNDIALTADPVTKTLTIAVTPEFLPTASFSAFTASLYASTASINSNYLLDSASFSSSIAANNTSIVGNQTTYLLDSASFSSSIVNNYNSYLLDSASFSSSIAVNNTIYLLDSASFSSSIASNNTTYLLDSASFSSSIENNYNSYLLDSASFSSSIVNNYNLYLLDSASFSSSIENNYNLYLLDSASFSSSIENNYNLYLLDSASFSSSIVNNYNSYLLDSASFSSSIENNYNSYLLDSASFSASLALNTNNYPLDSASFSSSIAQLETFSGSLSTPNYTGQIHGLFTGSFTGSAFGTLTGTSSYATNSENSLIDLDATNANRFVIFSANNSGPNALKADTGFEYNPNTNTLSVPNISTTAVVGNLTGNVTGNIVGTEADFVSITGSLKGDLTGSLVGSVSASLGITGSISGSLGQFDQITSSLANFISLSGSFLSASIATVTQLTSSFITGSFTGSMFGTASNATTASFALTSSYFAMPVARFSNSVNNVSLSNSADNNIRYNVTDYNTSIASFELIDAGLSTAAVYIKQPGYYEFITQIYLSGLGADVDILIKLATGASTGGVFTLVSLFNDYKSVEGTNDQTVTGTLVEYISTPGYYRVLVNPSNANITTITSNSTPPRLTVKKLG
jgi:hypothetical protein